jgi:hypothetical protein
MLESRCSISNSAVELDDNGDRDCGEFVSCKVCDRSRKGGEIEEGDPLMCPLPSTSSAIVPSVIPAQREQSNMRKNHTYTTLLQHEWKEHI